MGTLIETDNIVVLFILFIVLSVVGIFCGIAIGTFFFRCGEKRAEREIKKYFDSLRH